MVFTVTQRKNKSRSIPWMKCNVIRRWNWHFSKLWVSNFRYCRCVFAVFYVFAQIYRVQHGAAMLACVAVFFVSSQWEKARTKGKSREPPPLPLIFCYLCPHALARLPLAWKETETTAATQATCKPQCKDLELLWLSRRQRDLSWTNKHLDKHFCWHFNF